MLDDDEHPVGMWLGRVNDSEAYVTVTTARLFVTEVKLRQKRPSLIVSHDLTDLAGVELGRRRLKSTLVLHWRNQDRLVVTELSRRDLRSLYAFLRP
jgi:hypothetical protein